MVLLGKYLSQTAGASDTVTVTLMLSEVWTRGRSWKTKAKVAGMPLAAVGGGAGSVECDLCE